MNNHQDKDEPLHSALRQWKETRALPAGFQHQVWQRIEQTEACQKLPFWIFLKSWMEGLMLRPSLVVSYVTVLLLAGVATGYWQVQAKTTRLDRTLETRYVQAVDPYQKPRN